MMYIPTPSDYEILKWIAKLDTSPFMPSQSPYLGTEVIGRTQRKCLTLQYNLRSNPKNLGMKDS